MLSIVHDKLCIKNSSGIIQRVGDVAELAYAHGLGPCAERHEGSSPSVPILIFDTCTARFADSAVQVLQILDCGSPISNIQSPNSNFPYQPKRSPVKVSTEARENRQIAVTIEVAPEQVEAAMARAARKLAQKYKIPGFRPGKAPRAIIERTVGK